MIMDTDIVLDSSKNQIVVDHLKGLRRFLGVTGYYRRFIKDYAKIAKALNNLVEERKLISLE